jgi:outer membrane protein assembly factor BamB
VSVFIQPGVNGLHAVFGVFADEKHKTLWVCSNKDLAGAGTAELKSFDLKTGAAKGSYPLPGDGFCNDTAVAADGTAYVADTKFGQVFMLKRGAKDLEVAAKDPLLAGADGLAFGKKRVLYVNSVTTGKMLRVNLGKDGKATVVVDLKVSQPLTRPDGMRTIGKDRLLLAENSGNMDIVTFRGKGTGETAEIATIKSGLEATPAVTATRGMAWIAEGKLNLRSDPNKDAGVFKMFAVPVPKK